jgi:hypothetical protein
MARRLVFAAFVVSVLGAIVAAFAPLGGCRSLPDGRERCAGVSTFEVDGAWVLVVVSIPVLVSLLPVVIPRRAARVFAALLLWACCVVGAFSVGLFFVPAAVAMTIAAGMRNPHPASAPC